MGPNTSHLSNNVLMKNISESQPKTNQILEANTAPAQTVLAIFVCLEIVG